jgi:hypothetical protein
MTAAKAHYQEGLKRYNVGDFSVALDEFKAAYLAQPDPAFLFNLGQCQRQLSQYEAAEKSYRAFLREMPNLPQATREQVQKLVADMEQANREARARQKEPPTGTRPPSEEPQSRTAPQVQPVPVASVAAPTLPPPPAKPVHKRGWFIGLMVGVAVVAAGAAVGLGVGLTASQRTEGTFSPVHVQ